MLMRFVRDDRASVIPMFALALVTMMAAVGAAVDYSRANSARTAMQAAIDATALSLSRDAQYLTAAELTSLAKAYFEANFKRAEVQNLQVSSTLSSPQAGSFALHVSASGKLDVTFMGIFGHSSLDVGGTADVVWGIKKLELALVLDNTGSMASNGKLSQLKIASHNLLNTLKDAAKTDGDIRVSIIPFDTTVNIGTGYANEPWVDYSVNGIQKSKWKGCVEDRGQPYDVQDTTPTTSIFNTLFPAELCGSLTQAVPLTTDWTALHSKIDQMTAAGATNVTIGLVWGWHSLTSNLPFTQAVDPKPDLEKVIVLLTDGENTKNRWTTSTSSIDARTSAACANIKAANIKIYTVRVIDGNASLLQSCASKPSMFYNVQEASQLNAVFTSIAQNLANLRISK